jgi:hypothetical protein
MLGWCFPLAAEVRDLFGVQSVNSNFVQHLLGNIVNGQQISRK